MEISQYTLLADSQTPSVNFKGVEKRGPNHLAPPSKEELEDLYSKHTTWEIADIKGVNQSTVCRWCHDYEIALRPSCFERRITPPSKDEFIALHAKFTRGQIAKMKGVSTTTVWQWQRSYGLERNPFRVQPPPKEELERLYSKHSANQIAKIKGGVSKTTVKKWLIYYEIPIRGKKGRFQQPDITTDDILAMAERGLTRRQIAKELNTSLTLVRSRLEGAERDKTKQHVLDLRAKKEALEKELASKNAVERALASVSEKLKRLEAEQEGQEAKIGKAVEDAIPRFELLFSTAEIKRDPRVLRNNWQHAEFTWDETRAAREAYMGRSAKAKWPTVAARWLVALSTGYDIDTVKRYHNRYLRSA